jgi:hypothetical protein
MEISLVAGITQDALPSGNEKLLRAVQSLNLQQWISDRKSSNILFIHEEQYETYRVGFIKVTTNLRQVFHEAESILEDRGGSL